MAIEYLAGNTYTGLAADTKPTVDVLPGAMFVETDTGKVWVWDGSAWLEIPLDHANKLPPEIHVPYNFIYPDYDGMTGDVYDPEDEGKFVRLDDTEDIYMITDPAAPSFVKVSGSGSGEPNTASNVGTGGVGLFKQKTGIDLEFKNINSDMAAITITDDVPNNEVDIGFDPAAVDHNDLANIGPDDHHSDIHAPTHVTGGDDKIDGDILNIDYVPTNYTPSTAPSEVTQDYELTAHLAGIDNAIQNFAVFQNGNKYPVRLATAAALPAYTPSGSGVGKFLEANAVGALTIDGIGVVVGNRILVKNEVGAAQIHNGIYTVTNPGDGSNEWVLTRAVDYDQDTEIIPGHIVQSQEGNTNADVVWILTTNAPIAIESSYLIYTYAASMGITSITVIAPAANTTVDSVLLSAYHSAEWLVEVYESTTPDREVFKVIAREKSLSCAYSKYATAGDTINYSISFTSDGTSMSFKIQNNEAFSITVRVRRIEV